jgi:hypothetical protein
MKDRLQTDLLKAIYNDLNCLVEFGLRQPLIVGINPMGKP